MRIDQRPWRPYRPGDKAAVEMSVLVLQPWIPARLRYAMTMNTIARRNIEIILVIECIYLMLMIIVQ